MFVKFFIEFVDFLNHNDFSISSYKLYSLLKEFSNGDIYDENFCISLIKIFFARNKEDVFVLEKYFKIFYEYKMSDDNLLDTKDSESELNNLKAMIKQKQVDLKNLSIKEIYEFDYNDSKAIERLKKQAKEYDDLINILENIDDISFDVIDEKMKESIKRSENYVMNNQLDNFVKENEYFKFLSKINDLLKKRLKLETKILRDNRETYQNKQAEIEKEIDKLNNEYKETSKKIDAIKNAEDTLIKKSYKVKQHRDNFFGRQAVISEDLGEVGEVPFFTLTLDDMSNFRKYLKTNMNKFKSRMSKVASSLVSNNIDMKRIIVDSCRTSGLPLNIYYKKPMVRKSNLILVLDISGSCSKQSKVMLEFMYYMKSLFKGGCRTFVFVNDLYDISNIMKTSDIEGSIQDVFDLIPTRGVYSDYHTPFFRLTRELGSVINKDSFVIIIGDGRNNKNPSASMFMKEINDKAKKSYFLATEDEDSWGQGDSEVDLYSKVITTKSVTNLNELIDFIWNI